MVRWYVQTLRTLSVCQIPCIQVTLGVVVWRMVLAAMMMKFTRKDVGDMVVSSGLNEGMLVGLDWGTWVSRRAQIQQ